MRVLIAYDSSPGGEQALALADSIRWPEDSTLRIVTVVPPTVMYGGPTMAPGPFFPAPELDDQITAFHKDRVSQAARMVRSIGRSVEGVVLRGRPATVLVDEATQFAADLVIGGSRGHGSVSSLLLGSVSAEVVDHAPCPVLIARTPAITKVVFASDGSAPAAAAETILAAWSVFEGLPIQVVSIADVVEPWHTGIAPAMYRQVMEEQTRDLARARAEHMQIAEEAAARLRAAGRVAVSAMRTGSAAAEIIAATKEAAADLVVMGSRGRTGVARIVLGSVARNVLHGSAASVLVVHAARPSSGVTLASATRVKPLRNEAAQPGKTDVQARGIRGSSRARCHWRWDRSALLLPHCRREDLFRPGEVR